VPADRVGPQPHLHCHLKCKVSGFSASSDIIKRVFATLDRPFNNPRCNGSKAGSSNAALLYSVLVRHIPARLVAARKFPDDAACRRAKSEGLSEVIPLAAAGGAFRRSARTSSPVRASNSAIHQRSSRLSFAQAFVDRHTPLATCPVPASLRHRAKKCRSTAGVIRSRAVLFDIMRRSCSRYGPVAFYHFAGLPTWKHTAAERRPFLRIGNVGCAGNRVSAATIQREIRALFLLSIKRTRLSCSLDGRKIGTAPCRLFPRNFQTAKICDRGWPDCFRRQSNAGRSHYYCDFSQRFCLKSDRSSPSEARLRPQIDAAASAPGRAREGGSVETLWWTWDAPISGTPSDDELWTHYPLCRPFPRR